MCSLKSQSCFIYMQCFHSFIIKSKVSRFISSNSKSFMNTHTHTYTVGKVQKSKLPIEKSQKQRDNPYLQHIAVTKNCHCSHLFSVQFQRCSHGMLSSINQCFTLNKQMEVTMLKHSLSPLRSTTHSKQKSASSATNNINHSSLELSTNENTTVLARGRRQLATLTMSKSLLVVICGLFYKAKFSDINTSLL